MTSDIKRIMMDRDGFENLFIQRPNHDIHGLDYDSATVFVEDVTKRAAHLVQTFEYQPELTPFLPVMHEALDFDGLNELEIPTESDISGPLYVMTPERHDIQISGTSVTIPTPRLVFSAADFLDNWKQKFAGRNRVDKTLRRMRLKIEDVGEVVTLNGKTGITGAVTIGLVAGAYSSLNTTGAWGIDAGSNGHLANPKADFKQVWDYFTTNGYGGKPIVTSLTSYIYNVIKSSMSIYNDKSQLDRTLMMLPDGSRILPPSNNLQCTVAKDTYTTSVSTTSNTMLCMLDMGTAEKQGAVIAESGVQQIGREMDTFQYVYAQQKKQVGYVIDQEKVVKISSISNATS